MSENLRGILLMCAAMLAFVINDSFMKAVTQELPLFQAIALRGAAVSLALISLVYARTGMVSLRPSRPDGWVMWLRTGAEVLATVTFLVALTHMSLATLSAIMQALPLLVTLAAALIYRQSIVPRVWALIFAGFIGVLLIIKPGTAGFDRWSVLALMSVAFVVVRDLSTRHVSQETPSTTVAIWAALAVTVLGLVGMAWQGWQPPEWRHIAMIAGASFSLLVGYITVVMTMRVGDVALVAPFRYTALLWALVFGWLFFGTLPDIYAIIGAAIVVVSGIVTLQLARGRD